MADELRLGTLGDEIFEAASPAPADDAVLRGGISIPTPPQGGITIPIPPAFAAADDLPIPPIPLDGGVPMILDGGISIPTP
jgi:hypothetical protein